MSALDEFLVKLGYDYDKAGEAHVIGGAVRVRHAILEMAGAIEAASLAFVYGVAKIASSMEQLYYASDRTNSTVNNMQAFAFGVAQMGGNAEAARQSLEGLASFMRSSPGAAGLINSLGVATSGANGKQLPATTIMEGLAQKFKQMPFYRAQAYAGEMGIDQNTLIAMINGTGAYSKTYKSMTSAFGVHQQDYADARKFMIQLREIEAAFELIGIKAAGLLSGPLGSALAQVRAALLSHAAEIEQGLVTIGTLLGHVAIDTARFFVTLLRLLGDVDHWFNTLSATNRKWAVALMGLFAGIEVMSAGLLDGPLGLLFAALTAIVLLMQDYQTYKSGGKTWLDWGKDLPMLKDAYGSLSKFITAIGGMKTVFDVFLGYFSVKWVFGILSGFARVTASALKFLGIISEVDAASAVGGGVAAGIMGLAGGVAVGGAAAYALIKGAPWETSDYEGVQPAKNHMTHDGIAVAEHDAIRYFMSKGWTRQQAVGIVANEFAESRMDSTAVSPHGKSYGIGQWTATRQAEFHKLYGIPIQQSTFQQQLAFTQWELTHGVYKKAGEALAKTHSYYKAGSVVSRDYEAPAHGNYNAMQRGIYAKQYGDLHPGSPGGTVQVKSTINVHGTTLPESVKHAARRQHDAMTAALVKRDLLGSGAI